MTTLSINWLHEIIYKMGKQLGADCKNVPVDVLFFYFN